MTEKIKDEASDLDPNINNETNLSTVSGDKALEELASDMPEVVPDAVEAAEQKEADIQKSSGGVVDNKGRAFDSSLHATGADGRPLLTPTGRFKRINLPKERTGLIMPEREQPVDQSYKVVAKTVVGIFIQCGYAVVGDEWLPEKSKEMDEEGNLVAVTEVYCASIGLKDLPPGLVCATAFCAYGLRRFTRPKTKSVVEKLTSGVKNFFVSMWLKFRGKNARPNHRNNGDGKDNPRLQDGESLQK